MGCFNLKGFFSKVTIQSGDDIVLMIGLQKGVATEQFYTCQNIVPLTLPIYGKYNDYGGIEEVEETPYSKWIEEHLGKIDDVVDAVNECMQEYRHTIGECMDSDNSCHPDTNVRYVYANILNNPTIHINERSSLCLLVEHRSFYEDFAEALAPDDYHSLESYNKRMDENYENLISLGIEKEQARSWTYDNFIDMQSLFGNDSDGILDFHNYDFLMEHIDEVKKLQGFIRTMERMGHAIQIPMQYSQDDYYDSEVEYHQSCIDLINRLIKYRED